MALEVEGVLWMAACTLGTVVGLDQGGRKMDTEHQRYSRRLKDARDDLCTIANLHFPHDIPDMHLYGAFAYLQLKRDNFIRFAALQKCKHCFLPRGKPTGEVWGLARPRLGGSEWQGCDGDKT